MEPPSLQTLSGPGSKLNLYDIRADPQQGVSRSDPNATWQLSWPKFADHADFSEREPPWFSILDNLSRRIAGASSDSGDATTP